MIVLMIILIFLIGFQFLVIIALYADRMIYMYARGDDFGMLKMKNEVFDVLKWWCMLFLPALAVLVKTICSIWSLPLGNEISTTIMALNAFLAAILGISTIQYRNEGAEDGNS